MITLRSVETAVFHHILRFVGLKSEWEFVQWMQKGGQNL